MTKVNRDQPGQQEKSFTHWDDASEWIYWYLDILNEDGWRRVEATIRKVNEKWQALVSWSDG